MSKQYPEIAISIDLEDLLLILAGQERQEKMLSQMFHLIGIGKMIKI